MKCQKCQTEVAENTNYCSECGQELRSEKNDQPHSVKAKASASQDLSSSGVFRSLPGLRRTLSTEVIAREEELRTLARLNALIKSRTYQPGEVIVHKGERNRDLFFLTDGLVEISKMEHGGNIVLNQITAPNIFGEIGFLFGFPRTATAIAKTEVTMFRLSYDKLNQEIKEFPEWLSPILNSLVSGIKALPDEIKILTKKIKEMENSEPQ
jgi:CRP-like cAMP-binding protein